MDLNWAQYLNVDNYQMIANERGLPQQLLQDYKEDQERMNIAFIKLSGKSGRKIGIYMSLFINIIEKGHGIIRKNVLEFVKLMTTLDHFDFKSEFAIKVFECLVGFANRSNHQEQFEIVTYMLTNDVIQEKYLKLLVQCLGNNIQGTVNFSLSLLEKLMENTISFMEGKKKGPCVSDKAISNLLMNSFQMAKVRALNFSNVIDHKNFLRICSHSLQLMRKYSSVHKNHLLTYSDIWKSQLRIFSQLEIQVINQVFGILIELCNFKETYLIEEIEEEENFQNIVQCSAYCILSCENVNQFWYAYLQKRQGSSIDLSNFDETTVVNLFKENLFLASKTIDEIVQKLKITDNMFLLTNLMSKGNRMRKSFIEQKQILEHPEQSIRMQSIIQIALIALYSPMYKIQEGSVFFTVLSQMKTIYKQLDKKTIIDASQMIGLLNLLPPLKIIIKMAKNVLTLDDNVQTLIHFLFNFLKDRKHSEKFEEFIILICQKFKSQINSITEKNILRDYYSRANKIALKCLKKIANEGKNIINMGSYMRCIEALTGISKSSTTYRQSFVEIQWLINIVDVRLNKFDKQIFSLMSRLIKDSGNQSLGRVACFEKLYNLTINKKRIFYLQLLFDFAETHSSDQVIVQKMRENSGQISEACIFSHITEDSQLRNISFMIATQNINKDTQISKIIIENLFLIIRNSSFRGKLYEQITDLITKQRKIFIRNPSYKTGGDTVYQFILLMLKMLEVINDCVEENIKSKLEKTALCLKIAEQILKFVYIFTKEADWNGPENAKIIIEKIKKTIQFNKLKKFHQMEKVTKTLATSYFYLQASFRTNIELKDEDQLRGQISGGNQLMNVDAGQEERMNQEQYLLSLGVMIKISETRSES